MTSYCGVGWYERAHPVLYFNLRSARGLIYWPFIVNPRSGKLIVRVQKLRIHPVFGDETIRADLLDGVAKAAGRERGVGNVDGAPWVPVTALSDAGAVTALGDVLAWTAVTGGGDGSPATASG
jgi:hypothetical protein